MVTYIEMVYNALKGKDNYDEYQSNPEVFSLSLTTHDNYLIIPSVR